MLPERIGLAELQWVIEVRCVNALLAEIKVGETGEHFIVDLPARCFDPSEFTKLIDGVEAAKFLGQELYSKSEREAGAVGGSAPPAVDVKVVEERELYEIQLLSTGELAIVTVTTPQKFFAPSELDRFLRDLRNAQQKMKRLGAAAKA